MSILRPPRAVIFGLAGPVARPEELRFFRDANPCGFILFARNCRGREQIIDLVTALRDAVGRPDAPILIDQEGGRVARLKPPLARLAPPAQRFGALAAVDFDAALRAAWINARLIAADLAELGITVDCAPVLDVPVAGAHDVIGDRAFARDADLVARLGRAFCAGLLAGGVLPVIKHIPGHGRATADSHAACPIVDAAEALLAQDILPFRALADQAMAMTAHVVYRAWDAARPATLSPMVIEKIIRGAIGFDGVLLSDDLGMKALGGPIAARARDALAAGCDTVLHCDGDPAEMAAIAAEVPPLDGRALTRWQAALAARPSPSPADREALAGELADCFRSHGMAAA